MRIAILCALALVLAAGCERAEPRATDPRVAADRVGRLLYADNLISDPEVNTRLAGYVTAVDRDGAAPDSVLRELDAWLGEWTRQHPDRVARARLMPRGSAPGPRP